MTKDKLELTKDEEQRLLTAVYGAEDIGDHLTDDALAAHVMDLETAEDQTNTLQHLSRCEECRSAVEELQVATEKWRGPGGEQRFNELLDRTREHALAAMNPVDSPTTVVFDAFSDFRVPFVIPYSTNQPMAANFKTEKAPYRCETPDQLAAVSVVEKENGELWVYVDSQVPGLEGREIIMTVKKKYPAKHVSQWRSTLSRIDSDQVGAKLIITNEERQSLSEVLAFVIELKE